MRGSFTCEALDGFELDRKLTLADVPTASALSTQLKSLELDASEWGKGLTKSVDKLHEELTGYEAELEVWKKPEEGALKVLRVTHVLRAKVCSEKSKANGKFLFNTWQQFPDGRRRTRNGLLSEKLCVQEIPIEDHLIDVCERAVTEEEMQRLEASTFMITPEIPTPHYNPDYKCPLRVDNATLLEHTVQVESSASYPGLLTMYHLYTVDITCSGLPGVDFNTLEYTHPDSQGKRKLKYVHAWVWLGWADIQRYLLESSKMQERKIKGSYEKPECLRQWLQQFGSLRVDEWGGMEGSKRFRSVEELHAELEREEAQLELWGRHDGMNLLVRVVHVLQLQVQSTARALSDKFLLHVWQQNKDCQVDSQGCRRVLIIDRMVGHKLKMQKKSLGDVALEQAVHRAVDEQLSTVMDAFFTIDQFETSRTTINRLSSQANKPVVTVERVDFVDHRVSVEESPTYQGMQTMYHRYTCEAIVSGLPVSDFTTINFKRAGGPWVNGWRWVSWHQCVDHLHVRIQELERTVADRKREIRQLQKESGEIATGPVEADENLNAVAHGKSKDDVPSDLAKDLNTFQGLNRELEPSQHRMSLVSEGNHGSCQTRFPPSMVAKMAEDAIYDQEHLEQMAVRRRTAQMQEKEMREVAVRNAETRAKKEVRSMVKRRLWIPLGAASVLLLTALLLLMTAAINGGDVSTIVIGAFNVGLCLMLLGILIIMFRDKFTKPTHEDDCTQRIPTESRNVATIDAGGEFKKSMAFAGESSCPEVHEIVSLKI